MRSGESDGNMKRRRERTRRERKRKNVKKRYNVQVKQGGRGGDKTERERVRERIERESEKEKEREREREREKEIYSCSYYKYNIRKVRKLSMKCVTYSQIFCHWSVLIMSILHLELYFAATLLHFHIQL